MRKAMADQIATVSKRRLQDEDRASRSRSAEARRVLGGVLETFSEGHDTADLRAAREQMAQLSGSD